MRQQHVLLDKLADIQEQKQQDTKVGRTPSAWATLTIQKQQAVQQLEIRTYSLASYTRGLTLNPKPKTHTYFFSHFPALCLQVEQQVHGCPGQMLLDLQANCSQAFLAQPTCSPMGLRRARGRFGLESRNLIIFEHSVGLCSGFGSM